MHSKVQGFEVDVTVNEGRPRLQVAFGTSGESILDTDAPSIRGMENLAAVLTHAAKMASPELDDYWRKEHATLRANRNQDAP